METDEGCLPSCGNGISRNSSSSPDHHNLSPWRKWVLWRGHSIVLYPSEVLVLPRLHHQIFRSFPTDLETIFSHYLPAARGDLETLTDISPWEVFSPFPQNLGAMTKKAISWVAIHLASDGKANWSSTSKDDRSDLIDQLGSMRKGGP